MASDISFVVEALARYNTHLEQMVIGVGKLADSSNEMLAVLTSHSFPVDVLQEILAIAMKHDHAKEQLTESAQLLREDCEQLMELIHFSEEYKGVPTA